MISHAVLIKPKPDLAADERRAMIAALETAARTIPSVRNVRIGRRMKHGAGYEAAQPDTADLLLVFEFDDLEGLRAYLTHPAHEALGRMFYRSLSAAAAYDFESISLDSLGTLV